MCAPYFRRTGDAVLAGHVGRDMIRPHVDDSGSRGVRLLVGTLLNLATNDALKRLEEQETG